MRNISIIIAAKNEEKNIPFLISALLKLDYPNELFEVIIVDDNSTDSTYRKAEELTENITNFKIIKSVEKEYEGKRGALDAGIRISKFEYILITDADCIPQSNWLKEYSNKFDEGFDFLFGVAPFTQEKSLVNKLSCFDNLRSHILTFKFADIGLPYSASARNIGFSRNAFEIIGGYKNTTQTISGDDDLLLREAVIHNLKIGTIREKGSFVFSQTKHSFTDYLQQKARHTSTSRHYLPKHKYLLGFWHLLNIIFFLSIILSPISNIFLIPFAIKIVFDFILVKSNQKRYGYFFNNYEIIYLQFLYELFLIVHYIYGSVTKPKWK